MSIYSSPGVYPKEVDFSAYVRSLSTSICGLLGVFQKGVVGNPLEVGNFADFQANFGSYLTDHYGAYAAKAFFDNGGSRLVVGRTAHYADPTDASTLTALCSTKTLKDRDTTPVDTIKVEAYSQGTYADGWKITIADADGVEDGFDLTVTTAAGTQLAKFEDLVMDPNSADYFVTRINGTSKVVKVTDLGSETATPGNLPAVGTQVFAGGDDGLTGIVDADYIGDAGAQTGINMFAGVQMSMFMIPGIVTAPVMTAALAFAEGRLDLVVIGEPPAGLTPAQAVEYRKGTGNYTHTAFNSSYGALYYPWVKVIDPLTSIAKAIPPSGSVAGKYAYNDKVGACWTAPAGLNRGVLQNVVGVEVTLNQSQRDQLYEAGINPIANFPDGGVVIWGQRNLQAKASATDRVNVRRLMIHVEQAVSAASKFLVFEPANKQTWEAFRRLVNPFLQRIKDRLGLYDYYVLCDETTNTAEVIDQNQMIAKVFLKPTKTAEFLEVNFAITGTGANFAELFNAA